MATMKRLMAVVAGMVLMMATMNVTAQTNGPTFDETVEWLKRKLGSLGPVYTSYDNILSSFKVSATLTTGSLAISYDAKIYLHDDSEYRTDTKSNFYFNIQDVEITTLENRREGLRLVFTCVGDEGKAYCIDFHKNHNFQDGIVYLKLPVANYSEDISYTSRERELAEKLARAFRHLQMLVLAEEKDDLF